MNLFRVYIEWTITTWEFGFGVFFDKPFEIEFLLGPLSIGIVFGEQEEKTMSLDFESRGLGDFHNPIVFVHKKKHANRNYFTGR